MCFWFSSPIAVSSQRAILWVSYTDAVKTIVISLQSVTLFVRLTNHCCAKVLMFRSIVKEGKSVKKAFQCRDYSPTWSTSQSLGLQTGAHASSKPSWDHQVGLGLNLHIDHRVTHFPVAGVPGTDFPAKLLPACYKAFFFENCYVIT